MEQVTSLRWLTNNMVLSVAPRDLNTTLECSPFCLERSLSQMQEWLYTDLPKPLLIFCQRIQMLPFKWWRWPRSQMSRMLILVVWISRSKRSRRQLNSLLPIQSSMLKSVLTHLVVFSFMDHQELVKPCLQRLLPARLMPPLSEWLDLSSSRNISVKDLVWSEMSLEWPRRTPPQSCSSMR